MDLQRENKPEEIGEERKVVRDGLDAGNDFFENSGSVNCNYVFSGNFGSVDGGFDEQ